MDERLDGPGGEPVDRPVDRAVELVPGRALRRLGRGELRGGGVISRLARRVISARAFGIPPLHLQQFALGRGTYGRVPGDEGPRPVVLRSL